jgi:16S rRNA processing protein RimM
LSGRAPSSKSSGARLRIGRVGSPHGLVGRVKVRLAFSGSESLGEVDRVWLVSEDGNEREFSVREVRGEGAQTLLWLEGIANRDEAARIVGSHIEILRDELAPLAPGEYYLADLVGAAVFGPDGQVGEVVDVVVNPSIDSLRIRLADGRLAEQPLSMPWVTRIEAENARIELASLDGLIV